MTRGVAGVRTAVHHLLLVAVTVVLGSGAPAAVWLLTNPGGNGPELPYVWPGMAALGFAFGFPVATLYGFSVAPLAWLIPRCSPLAGGRIAVTGAVGGTTYLLLVRRSTQSRSRRPLDTG